MARQIKKSDVVNVTGGVTTDDGRTLFGLDAEVYLKMKAKEDPDWERKVGEWIEDALGKAIEDTSDLWKSLKSGVVLCELINTIKPNTIKKFNNKSSLHVLMERENINLYLDACYRLGVPSDGLFVTSDLHGRRNMAGVLSNIRSLSQLAGRFGNVKIPALGSGSIQVNLDNVKPSAKPPSKWNVPQNTGPVMAGDLVEEAPNVEAKLANAEKALQEAQLKSQKLETSNNSLKQDLQNLREQLRSKGGGDGGTAPTPSASSGSAEIQLLKNEIQSLKKQLETKPPNNSAEQALKNEIESLKKQLETKTANNTATADQALKNEILSLKNEIQSLKKQLETKTANNTATADQALKNEIAALKKQLADAETKRRQLEQSATADQSLKNEIESLKKQLADSRQQQPNTAQIQNLKDEINTLKNQLTESENKRKQVEQQPVTSARLTTGSSQSDTKVLQAENLALKKEIEEFNKKSAEASSSSESLKTEINDLRKKVRELEVIARKPQTPSPNLDRFSQIRKSNEEINPKFTRASRMVNSKLEEEDMEQIHKNTLRDDSHTFFHHYEDVDPADFKKLSTVISLIVDITKSVELEDVQDLQDVLSLDSGRRYFTHVLKNHIELCSNGKMELQSEAFEALLYLFNKTLEKLDLQNGADYISAKMMLEMAGLIYRKESVYDEEEKKEVYKRDYIEYRIKDHVIWQSLFFWEEYFWDTIALNFRNVVGEGGIESEEYSDKEKVFLKKALKKFAVQMCGWGELKQESVAYFTENIADSIGLDKNQTQAILSKINNKTSKPKEKAKKRVRKMKISSVLKKAKAKVDGETPDKRDKPEKIKSPKPEKQEKPPKPEKLKSPKPEKPEKPDKLKAKGTSTPLNTSSPGITPKRPASAPPVLCDKCRQSFRSAYELTIHKC